MHLHTRLGATWASTFLAAVSSCVITSTGGGDGDCGSPLSHSHISGSDTCKCDAGYTWEHPEDPEDFDCERIRGKGGSEAACTEPFNVIVDDLCYCEGGYTWCAREDPNDYSCCVDDAQDAASATGGFETGDTASTSESTTADTTAGESGAIPDDADCTAQAEGVVFCSNTDDDGPQASRYWVCTDAMWQELPSADDESCQSSGYDFAFGCVDDGTQVVFLCGRGPGSSCEDATEATCIDADVINTCLYGRLTEDSCATLCNTIGDADGVTYESGFCDAEASPPECFCCDSGEEGCPV